MSKIENPQVRKKQKFERQWVEGLLVSAQKRKWYGNITIKLKRGMIDVVESLDSQKPPPVPE